MTDEAYERAWDFVPTLMFVSGLSAFVWSFYFSYEGDWRNALFLQFYSIAVCETDFRFKRIERMLRGRR